MSLLLGNRLCRLSPMRNIPVACQCLILGPYVALSNLRNAPVPCRLRKVPVAMSNVRKGSVAPSILGGLQPLEIWPSTLKFDRAIQPFLKIDS